MYIENIGNLRRKADYYFHDAPDWVRKIWPRSNSFSWFIKNNRQTLRQQGALVRLGRDYFIDAAAFPAAAQGVLGLTDEDDGASQ
jgi:hypothetical protein